MKKISVISILSILMLPSWAEEATTPATETNESDVVAQYENQFEQPKYETTEKYSNPEIKFPRGVQLGLGVSPTSGLNMFVGYNNKKFESFWWKRFGLRLDFATYAPIKSRLDDKINDSIGKEGIEIDKNLKIGDVGLDGKHFGALVDFYPFGDTWFLGGWRISGGYMTGNLDLKAKITGKVNGDRIEFEIGDRKYMYEGKEMFGKAKINWKYSGPYLGTGFDLGILYGFKLYVDAGLVFVDDHAKAKLDVPVNAQLKDITDNPMVPEDMTETLKDKLEVEKAKAVADAQKELDKVDYYPLVKIGFMYRF